MGKIFAFLCRMLALVGKPFGWDYYTVSVYVCLHLWPLICVAMSVAMLVCAVVNGSGLWITACAIYVLLNVLGYLAVIRHYYPGSIPQIFNQCYEDLMTLAREWHTTYAIVNLFFYIILFALLMTFDITMMCLMLQ